MILSGRLSPKVSDYYSNLSLVENGGVFVVKFWSSFFQSKKLLTCFENCLATARIMGKKKAKEPETPAKDEVSNFAWKSTENLLIDFSERNWLFEVLGNLRVLLNSFIRDEITQSAIKIVLWVLYLIYLWVLELRTKQNGSVLVKLIILNIV